MGDTVYLFNKLDYDKELIKNNIILSKVMDEITSGDTVIIKPNFVQEHRNQDDDWDYVITHPIVITSVLELVADRLSMTGGKIVLADAPMTSASFQKILSRMPVTEWEQYCKSLCVEFQIIDLRDEEWEISSNGIIIKRSKLLGDPAGKVLANLQSDNSEFYSKRKTKQKLYGADYNIEETNQAHNGENNYYSVSKTVVEADVFINIPKLKTHRKAGITCCLKNLVGINTNKNLIPHHTNGTPKEGGDQFATSESTKLIEGEVTRIAKYTVTRIKFLSPLLSPLKKIAVKAWGSNNESIRSGGWYGNDTLWRSILDLNKILFYVNTDGTLRLDKYEGKKKFIGIVDGIYGGQGDGPLEPDKIEAGILICGTNPVAIDCVSAKKMGFDYHKIPQLINAFYIKNFKLINFQYEEIICIEDGNKKKLSDLQAIPLSWEPAFGWKGHIEDEI